MWNCRLYRMAASNGLLLDGLQKLEYRGYDSAGLAMHEGSSIRICRAKGRIADLQQAIDAPSNATTGIGHTRWATHGEPSERNAHPHTSTSGRFTIVHNGVIENEMELRRDYLQGMMFQSDTDTEVIVQLLEKHVDKGMDTQSAFRSTLQLLKGSYAVAVLDREDSETIYIAKNKSPLLIGIGEGFHMVASDAMALLQWTNRFMELIDGDIVMMKPDGMKVHNREGDVVERKTYETNLDPADMDKGMYPHYMLKEIDEQPAVIRRIMTQYQNADGGLWIDPEVRQMIKQSDRLYMIACGTSYHAGLVGKYLFEKVAKIPAEAHVASEFLYNPPLLSKRPLFILISQSGETADSRGVLVLAKQLGHPVLTITNVPGSTLAREGDFTLLTHAGPEIAVASTKAYTAQIAILALLAFDYAHAQEGNSKVDMMHELSLVANAMEMLIGIKEQMKEVVWDYLSLAGNCFFIGRGLDYYTGLEGALKLKEVSYLQAEGFAGGELKHGTIALIEQGTPVIALDTQKHVHGCIRSNVKEVEARGAKVCMISMDGLQRDDDVIVLPRVHELLTPLVSVIPLQLIAYYAANFRGCDIDKPRNLAKSVTVE